MVDVNLIEEELSKLSLNYRAAKVSPDEIDELKNIWAEDLEELANEEFREAVRISRRRSSWFPTSADVLHVALQNRQQQGRIPHQHEALPATPTQLSETERKNNKKRARALIEWLRGKKERKPSIEEEAGE